MRKKIIAFAASSSSRSINRQLVSYAAGLLTEVEVEILDRDRPSTPIAVDAFSSSAHELLLAAGTQVHLGGAGRSGNAADAWFTDDAVDREP